MSKAFLLWALFLLRLMTLAPESVFAATTIDRSMPAAYGIGVVTCPYKNSMLGDSCFRDLSWLREPIKVYRQPMKDAEIAGTILDPQEDASVAQLFHFVTPDGLKQDIGIIEVSYEESAIVVHEKKDGWLRIGEGWVSSADIKLDASTTFMPWSTVLNYTMEGIADPAWPYIGRFYPIEDQDLLESPGGKKTGAYWQAREVESLPDLLVLERKGDWIKVLVDNKSMTCGDRDPKPTGKVGWIRLTNKDGNPLVYWHTRGC